MIDRYQRELDKLFEEQEAGKKAKYAKGGRVKAWDGLTVDGPDDPTLEGDYSIKTPLDIYGGTMEPWLIRGAQQMPEGVLNFWDKAQLLGKNVTNDLKENGGKYAGYAAAASPILYNIGMGLNRPRNLNPREFYNPYANQVASLMRDRRINVQPQLDAILDAQHIANYNAARVGAGGIGNIQGNYAAIANNAMRNRAGVLANKQNMDLGYKGEEAQMFNREGLHRAGINFNIKDWNEQALANKYNYFAKATEQANMLAQMQMLMGNQARQSEQLAGLYPDMFSVSRYMPGVQEILNNYIRKQS